jgi:peptide/nickel transport system substrate-binding protein
MRGPARSTRLRLGLAGVAGVVALVAGSIQGVSAMTTSQAAPKGAAAAGHACLVMTGSGDPAFTSNFNPYTGSTLNGGFVKGAFYEPLMVSTVAGGGHVYPWLAQSWKWSHGNKTLTLSIRKGVTWSDHQPLTAADVVYSLTAGKQDKSMDVIGLYRKGTNIKSVKLLPGNRVAINLRTPDSQFIAANLNLQFVVPKHIWSKIGKPATYTNPHPIGSGPFTKIKRLTTQDIVFAKNPHYWQAGKPKIPCLEYQEAASNDAALLLIQSGKVDWTHNFVPNVESAYEAKDRAHYHAFYATTAYPISLMFDDTQYPYSLVPLRQAMSMAINRSDVSKLGEYGYAPPTDAIGLNGIFPQWVTDPGVKAEAKRLATYNPGAAKKLLTDSGFTYKGNKLLDPKGNPVSFQIHVISGWSDWVASLQIITKNLQQIGIDATTQLEPDWNSWYPGASTTKQPTLLWQNASQGSPYGFFFANLSQNALIPPGQDATATGNWEHYSDPTATNLLNQWKLSLTPTKQHAAATALEKLWLKTLPVVPLFIGPRWSTYSTKYFHCFTSPKNYYADPIFNTFPDDVVTFTHICPGGQTGP